MTEQQFYLQEVSNLAKEIYKTVNPVAEDDLSVKSTCETIAFIASELTLAAKSEWASSHPVSPKLF